MVKWALKFSTRGKKEGDAARPYQSSGGAADSFRNGGGGLGGAGQGGFRSSSDGEEGDHDHERGLGVDSSNSPTPIVTPPDANGGGGGEQPGENKGGGGVGESGGGGGAATGHNSAPQFTVDAGRAGHGEGEEEEEEEHYGGAEGVDEEGWVQMNEDVDGAEGDRQEGVFEEDSQEDADSLHASKTARMKSFADDPEAHVLGDSDAEWDGVKPDSGAEDGAGRRDGEDSPTGSPRASRGDDRFSGNGGGGSHSYHSEAERGTEEGYASNASPDNPSRGRTSTDGLGGKSTTFTSFGGMSGGNQTDGEPGRRQDDLDMDDQDGHHGDELDQDEDGHEQEDDEHDEHHRHQDHGEIVGDNGGRYGSGGGGGSGSGGHHHHIISGAPDYGGRNSRDQADVERRANAHSYADCLDASSREAAPYGGTAPGYGSNDRQHRGTNSGIMPPAPPGAGANGISPVDARAAAALASRTRLAAGGVGVPDRAAGVQRPEPGPVMGPGQAAAAAAAALRRGPTPGSHSLPSMVLVPLEALKAHRRVPRSSDRRALVRYRDLPDRSRSFVVFVSHAWMRPHTTPSFAHPDTSSRGGEKYRLIAEAGDRIRAHLPPDVRVLLWIDYSCVDQDSTRRSKATMRGMREYMRRCDAILTVYPGDAADNGEEFLPNRFVKSCAWAGSYKSLAHYCTRGWCRLEMLLGQTEPLPQDGFMFNFLVPKKKKASGAKASVGDRPHFLYGAHQRPHNGRIDVVPRQSSRWFEEHHPEQGNFTHESDRDAIRAVLAKQTTTMAKRSAAIAARYGTDPRRGGGGGGASAAVAAAAAATSGRPGGPNSDRQHFSGSGEYGRPH